MASRVEGLQKFRQSVIGRFPREARDLMRAANEKSANEFVALIEQIIPRGDPEDGNLVDTLHKRDGDPGYGGLGVLVSIGGPDQPHPLHLEAGHKARDGSHVPPTPFWNPARHRINKRHKGRASRALSKAIKMITGGAGG